LSPDGIKKRDQLVFEKALTANIPIVMVLSGGYQMENAEVIAESILEMNRKFHLVEKSSAKGQEQATE